MLFGGFQRTTLVDCPGRVASIAFVLGCNMLCHYCYNPNLVFRKTGRMDEEVIIDALRKRMPLIDAIVVTGGEPTIWKDLPLFLGRLKSMGFYIKLDTNGSNPLMLKYILGEGLADYVAMDVKAPWRSYRKITGVAIGKERMIESAREIKLHAPDYEFRTTLAPGLSMEDLEGIAQQLGPAKRWLLQPFSSTRTILDPSVLSLPTVNMAELEGRLPRLSAHFQECRVR
ncbi:MAG TPA: anaerobic ribonucleoside-triphosphate reductase activating protein [Candidatus Saccharimonadales bacterium]|nr:anaerobic ribonucleoside-triphosphate reductase activating protein [Candidatus Saccharimonadales bacterium]